MRGGRVCRPPGPVLGALWAGSSPLGVGRLSRTQTPERSSLHLPGRQGRGDHRPVPSHSDPVVGFAGQRPPWTPCEYPWDPHLSVPTTPTQGQPGCQIPNQGRGEAGLLEATETWPPPRVSVSSERADGPCVEVREPLGMTPTLASLPPQGEAGVSGLPGGLGLRGPPVSGFPRPSPPLGPPTSTTRASLVSPLPFSLPSPASPPPFPFLREARVASGDRDNPDLRSTDTRSRSGRGGGQSWRRPPRTQSSPAPSKS